MSAALLFWVLAPLVALVLASYVVELLRREPPEPEGLAWAPEIPIHHTAARGVRLRYIVAGSGPPLVLLHTLRTQLDLFQKVIPELSRHFTVYAPDYPGHGWSEIPWAEYTPDLFVESVTGFLDALDIRNATVAGISIGGSIALLLAARGNPRVARVVSINPYDYAGGGGIGRASPVARLIFTLARVPILGDTVMRLRNPLVERKIFEGGVTRPEAIPPELLEEFYWVGNRRGHYRAFLNLIRNAGRWEQARREYRDIGAPVLLVYGDRDWSTLEERAANIRAIPGAKPETLEGGGHFLALDQPAPLTRLIIEFAGSPR